MSAYRRSNEEALAKARGGRGKVYFAWPGHWQARVPARTFRPGVRKSVVAMRSRSLRVREISLPFDWLAGAKTMARIVQSWLGDCRAEFNARGAKHEPLPVRARKRRAKQREAGDPAR